MSKVDKVRRLFEPGTLVVCVENTYRPQAAGTQRLITHATKAACSFEHDGRRMWMDLPTRVRDIVALDGNTVTYLLDPAKTDGARHTLTVRVLPARWRRIVAKAREVLDSADALPAGRHAAIVEPFADPGACFHTSRSYRDVRSAQTQATRLAGSDANAFVVTAYPEGDGTSYAVRNIGCIYYTHHAGDPGAEPELELENATGATGV